ncbi:MAG: hypothetical protein RKU31_15835 [Deltaproteobacteria bacterium]|jgi:hypothetical protein
MDLVKIDTSMLTPFLAMGRAILGLAFALWILRETFELATKGRCDFARPLIRVAFAYALLSALPTIGAWAASAAAEGGTTMFAANESRLFVAAYEHAVQNQIGPAAEPGSTMEILGAVSSLFTVRGLVNQLSMIVYLGMQASKLVVLHVLWPVCLSLVVVGGTIAVPLGAIPGSKGIEGWIKNLVEVSLWPLVFNVILSLMVASLAGLLRQVQTIDFATLFDPVEGSQAVLIATRWWAVCIAYCLLVWFTPVVSALLVRSAPVAVLGGLIAAQMIRLGSMVATGAASAGLGRFAGAAGAGVASGAMGGSGGHSGSGATTSPSPVFRITNDNEASGLDRREHRGGGK